MSFTWRIPASDVQLSAEEGVNYWLVHT